MTLNKWSHICFLVFMAFLNIGCANKSLKLSDEDRVNISDLDILVNVVQPEIKIADVIVEGVFIYGNTIMPMESMDFQETQRRNEKIEPIKKDLSDFSYSQFFVGKLESELKAIDWAKVRKVRSISTNVKEEIESIYQKSDVPAIIYIEVSYELLSDLSGIVTNAEIYLLPNWNKLLASPEEKVRKVIKDIDRGRRVGGINDISILRKSDFFEDYKDLALYKNDFILFRPVFNYIKPVPTTVMLRLSRGGNAKKKVKVPSYKGGFDYHYQPWLEKNSRYVRLALEESAAQTIRFFLYDLNKLP